MDKKVKCVKEARAGRVKVAHLEITRYQKQPKGVRDYFPEREYTSDTVVIEVGRKMSNGQWDNKQLWLTTTEFFRLREALEKFDDAEAGNNKPQSPRPSNKSKLTDDEQRLAELHDRRKSELIENGEGEKPSSGSSDNESEGGDLE